MSYGPERASALCRWCNRPARSFAKSPAKLNRSFSEWRNDRFGSKAVPGGCQSGVCFAPDSGPTSESSGRLFRARSEIGRHQIQVKATVLRPSRLGDVGVAQDVCLKFHVVQPTLDDVANADNTG